MLVLAVLHLGFCGLTALVGLFANGGSLLERLLLVVVHPSGAVVLLIAVLLPSLGRQFLGLTIVILLISVTGDLTVSMLIVSGGIKGDWILPLMFLVVPIVGIVYLSGRLFNVRSSTRNS